MIDFRKVNIPIMILSLGLSMMLWLHVKTQNVENQQVQRQNTFTIPLEIRNTPTGMAVVRSQNDVYSFTAIGDPEQTSKIDTSRLQAYVDLSSAKPGEREYPVKLIAPAEYRVEWLPKQPQARVEVDEVIRRSVPVIVETAGQIRDNQLIFSEAVAEPTTITVEGAETLVQDVDRARAILDLTRVQLNGEYSVQVELLDKKGLPIGGRADAIRAVPQTVTLRPSLAVRPPEKSVLIQPVWDGQPAYGYTIEGWRMTPNQVLVRSGSQETLASLMVIQTEPISIEGIREDTTIPIKLRLPEGVTLVGQVNPSVRVTVRRQETPPADPPANPPPNDGNP